MRHLIFLSRNGRRSKLGIAGIAVAAILVAFGIGPAHAIELSLIGGDPDVIPRNFDLNSETGLSTGDEIRVFNSDNDYESSGGGLFLDEAADLTFEYLGSEAAFNNTFSISVAGFGQLFSNKGGTPLRMMVTATFAGGIIPFSFASDDGDGPRVADNAGSIYSDLSEGSYLWMAFAAVSEESVIVLFGDGYGDSDYDDFAVRISVSEPSTALSAVPLPPAVWLFLSAILGLVSFSRIRRSEHTA